MTAAYRPFRARISFSGSPGRKTFAIAWTGLVAAACLGLSGCGSDATPPSATSSAGGGSNVPGVNPLGRPRCQAPAGVNAAPRSVEEAVDLLNALPKPTSVACFVESLARPLQVYATSSPFSAQPAFATRSPRLFVKYDKLWLSVVIDGESSYLIEFGVLVDEQAMRSLKGELKLPLDAPVTHAAPFDRVRYDTGTVCGLCHLDERQDASISFTTAFASNAFRPRPDSRVSVDGLRIENQLCDWKAEPARCEMLSAVFDGGMVNEVQFPPSMRTFF